MASDEIVWQIVGHQHCSYRLKVSSKTQSFCRNEYNLTGFCNRQSCPLANSRYATIRPDPETGSLCLYLKSVERAHLPSQWWEKVRLSNNYEKALAQIDEKLLYWPKFMIHKCKQRLTRLTQVAIRTRRIAKEQDRLGEKLVPRLASKVRRREATRERKAESAAKVERAIERELIERLRSGAYGDKPINVEENVWKKVLKGLERAETGLELEEEEEEEEREAEVEYVSDLEETDGEFEQEMEDFDDWLGDQSVGDSDEEHDSETANGEHSEGDSDEDVDDEDKPAAGVKRKRQLPSQAKPRKKPAHLEIEYETETPQREALLA